MPRPVTMVMNRYHGTNVSPSWKPVVPKNVGIWRVRLFGSQMPDRQTDQEQHEADGHDELRDQGAPASRRMRMRSISAPRSGAATSTVIANATSGCTSSLTFNSQ